VIEITRNIFLHEAEISFTFIRSPGPGGQNVNKLATAVQLRFNVHQSSLPQMVRERLVSIAGRKITQQGDLIIKASRYRTQERNKADALARLQELIKRVAITPKKRKKTKPTLASKQRRLSKKKLHSKTKLLRRHVNES
jgi:ribosome-associated protein